MYNIVGHDQAVGVLTQAIESDSHAHAYLFEGPSHVGKGTLALQLAQALNCESPSPPCGNCPSCRRIAERKHADINIIGVEHGSAHTEISIDQIREVCHEASLPPYEGQCRVFIIDGAEFLSLEAANCLLKTLEEPPGKVVFILLATFTDSLPSTVVSRCEQLTLRPVAVSRIEKTLVDDFGLDLAKSRLISRLSCGLPGWAFTAARDESLLSSHYERRKKLLDLFELTDADRLLYSSELAKRFVSNREEVMGILRLWLSLGQDIMFENLGLGEFISNIDFVAVLRRYARMIGLLDVRRFIACIESTITGLRHNANPIVAFDCLVLAAPSPQGAIID